MYSLLRRRTMMTKPSVVPTERLIYQLYDYTCDGTINTFIDTGIKLFGYEYDSFRIEMEYDGLDLITQNNQETIIECKKLSTGDGLVIRTGTNPNPYKLCINTSPILGNQYFGSNGSQSSARITYVYNKSNNSLSVDDEIKNFSGAIFHERSLTIGGRYASENNPDRFVQVHISSLKIYATPSGIDTTYIYLPLTFKCLTGGDLSIKNTNGSYDRNFEYSLNGGAWTAFDLPKNTASKLIATLSPNDIISFRRDNDNFADAQFLSDSNLTFDIYGNLLSLQYGSAFSGQTELRNTSKKAFGALFSGTNVVDASKLMLTATTLSNECYSAMFKHCTSLVSAPIVFATTLGSNSLRAMFSECYNLVNVQPQLYATTLSVNCCYEMFNDCQSLVNAPILPATTLAEGCYYTMFRQCYSLTVAPELPATTMKKNCYYGMFSGCRSFTTAPNLPATTIGQECYKEMFNGCISLTIAPNKLPATTLAKSCYELMFVNCTSLTTAPELPATTLASNCYDSMFEGCISLIAAPELPATTLANACYMEMFKNCKSITTAPNLPATTLANNCYGSMFRECSNLVYAPNKLPATTLADYCYSNMFRMCTKLLAAPELPAATLVANCYEKMFNSCSQLSYIKCLATNISATNCIDSWLGSVSNTGTFVKASGATWNTGIPSGWTVVDAS